MGFLVELRDTLEVNREEWFTCFESYKKIEFKFN